MKTYWELRERARKLRARHRYIIAVSEDDDDLVIVGSEEVPEPEGEAWRALAHGGDRAPKESLEAMAKALAEGQGYQVEESAYAAYLGSDDFCEFDRGRMEVVRLVLFRRSRNDVQWWALLRRGERMKIRSTKVDFPVTPFRGGALGGVSPLHTEG